MFIFKNSTLRKLRKVNLSVAPYVKIRECTSILVKNKFYEISKLSNNIIYDILIGKETLSCNKMESVFNKEFNIINKQQTWKTIYEQKIVSIKIEKLREFNFKLLHNIVPCGYILSKWNDKVNVNCQLCGEIETTKHMLYECTHIRNIWDIISNVMNMNIKWKHIVTGFYNCETKRVCTFNHLMTVIVYAIFKENMHAKYEGIVITTPEIIRKVKSNIQFYQSLCHYIMPIRIVSNVLSALH